MFIDCVPGIQHNDNYYLCMDVRQLFDHASEKLEPSKNKKTNPYFQKYGVFLAFNFKYFPVSLNTGTAR